MSTPISDVEREFIREMDALSTKILESNGQRMYDLIRDNSWVFTSGDIVELSHSGSAYQLWAGITDLVGAPWGPHSDEACESVARIAAQAWLQTNRESYEAIEAYFEPVFIQLRKAMRGEK